MNRRRFFALLIAAALGAVATLLLRPSAPFAASSPSVSPSRSIAVVRPADFTAEHAALVAASQLADPRARARALGQAFQALLDRDAEAALLALRFRVAPITTPRFFCYWKRCIVATPTAPSRSRANW